MKQINRRGRGSLSASRARTHTHTSVLRRANHIKRSLSHDVRVCGMQKYTRLPAVTRGGKNRGNRKSRIHVFHGGKSIRATAEQKPPHPASADLYFRAFCEADFSEHTKLSNVKMKTESSCLKSEMQCHHQFKLG